MNVLLHRLAWRRHADRSRKYLNNYLCSMQKLISLLQTRFSRDEVSILHNKFGSFLLISPKNKNGNKILLTTGLSEFKMNSLNEKKICFIIFMYIKLFNCIRAIKLLFYLIFFKSNLLRTQKNINRFKSIAKKIQFNNSYSPYLI